MSYCLVVADEPKLKTALAHEPLVVSMYTVKKEVIMKLFLFHSSILLLYSELLGNLIVINMQLMGKKSYCVLPLMYEN